MKRTLIIEDEQIAAQNLQRLLSEVAPQLEVVGVLQSVEESVEFFSNPENEVDLVFMDIHLADGLAFLIFDRVNINSPVIFTTAYDQYALDAFKVNSIDYLLKPINKDDLTRAINKLQRFERQKESIYDNDKIAALLNTLQSQTRTYKSYFLIPLRDKLVPLQVSDIAYIMVEEKTTLAVTYDGQSHALDKPLEAVLSQLDPAQFFRANRQFIIAHDAVKDISVWPIGKLRITLTVPNSEKVIISRARTSEFKEWYTN